MKLPRRTLHRQQQEEPNRIAILVADAVSLAEIILKQTDDVLLFNAWNLRPATEN